VKALRTVAALAVVTGLGIFSAGCEKLKARDHLNKGVASFKSSRFPEAIQHFSEAVRLDPTFTTARLYLATAYMTQYIPGADSEENRQNAAKAKEHFLKVLEQDPNNALAIESMASLNYNEAQGIQDLQQKLKKLDEARVWYERLAKVDPNRKEAFYSLGVITWAKWYPALQSARVKLGMKPDDKGPLKDPKVRQQLKEEWGAKIEEGIKYLERALQIDPEYDDAMAYMNLLIRERADLADTPEQYEADIKVADNWVQKALETKKLKAERAAKKGPQKAE
jgi:tetratricopeptide (TPR) repeat protein